MPASDIGSSVSYTEYSEPKRDYTKMEEFLQAVGVWWCFTHTFGAMIGIPFLCLLGIIFMPKLTIAILAPYSIWYLYDRESSLVGKPSELIKYYCRYAWHWKMFREYASAKLVKTSDLDPSRNYLSCFHPHGLIGSSLFINIHCNPKFEKVYPGLDTSVTTLPSNFYVPFWRDYIIGLGINSCEREGIIKRLSNDKKGHILVLVVGGGEEFVYMEKDLVLKKRKGFAKIALETGSSLLPIIGFGENNLFSLVKSKYFEPLHSIAKALFRCQFPVITSQGFLGILPTKTPLVTVVGKPIHVERKKHPTKQEIDKLHQQYMDSLVALYNDFKDIYDKDRKRDMRFVL